MASSKKQLKTRVSAPDAAQDAFFTGLLERVKHTAPSASADGDDLHLGSDEGQLAVDVAQNNKELVVMATIAGARQEDISINIFNDLLTIRGQRHQDQNIEDDDYFYRECFWGSFSRTIVLPVDVLPDEARATLKNGVLTVCIPKAKPQVKVPLKVLDE